MKKIFLFLALVTAGSRCPAESGRIRAGGIAEPPARRSYGNLGARGGARLVGFQLIDGGARRSAIGEESAPGGFICRRLAAPPPGAEITLKAGFHSSLRERTRLGDLALETVFCARPAGRNHTLKLFGSFGLHLLRSSSKHDGETCGARGAEVSVHTALGLSAGGGVLCRINENASLYVSADVLLASEFSEGVAGAGLRLVF